MSTKGSQVIMLRFFATSLKLKKKQKKITAYNKAKV